MCVYEYGQNCPEPNQRRVYISYLDSVHYFRPKQYRTAVYHEILASYLDYVKKRGFHTAHIWSCPPAKGDDYIFYCHPNDQRTPKTDKLQKWYADMLEDCKLRGIATELTDIHTEFLTDPNLDATVLPYFEGDYWTTEAEVIIKGLKDDAKILPPSPQHPDSNDDTSLTRSTSVSSALETSLEESCANEAIDAKSKSKRKSKSGEIKKRPTRSSKGAIVVPKSDGERRDPVMAKLASIIEPMKNTFFVVRLHTKEYIERCKGGKILEEIPNECESSKSTASDITVMSNINPNVKSEDVDDNEKSMADSSNVQAPKSDESNETKSPKADCFKSDDAVEMPMQTSSGETEGMLVIAQNPSTTEISADISKEDMDVDDEGSSTQPMEKVTGKKKASEFGIGEVKEEETLPQLKKIKLEEGLSQEINQETKVNVEEHGVADRPSENLSDVKIKIEPNEEINSESIENSHDNNSSMDQSTENQHDGIIESKVNDIDKVELTAKKNVSFAEEVRHIDQIEQKVEGKMDVDEQTSETNSTVEEVKPNMNSSSTEEVKSDVGKDVNTIPTPSDGMMKKEPDIKTESNIKSSESMKIEKSSSTSYAKSFSDITIRDDTEDVDEVQESEHWDTRQSFLNLCQGNHYQFDQLRRAKHTSMMVLYHLHNPDAPKFVPNCTHCHSDILVGNRHRCEPCDIDICSNCIQQGRTHSHPLRTIPVGGQAQVHQLTEQERRDRQRHLQLHMELLQHCSYCEDSNNCKTRNCAKMKVISCLR
jgi:hypothetical protein